MSVKEKIWKWGGVLIILYSLIAGLLVPLGPGLVQVEPGRAANGTDVTLEVVGYNTHFTEKDTRAWLKWDDAHIIPSTSVSTTDRRHLQATFPIPRRFPGTDSLYALTLIVHNGLDGPAVLPSALFVHGNDRTATVGEGWSREMVTVDKATSFHFPFRNILAETIRNTYYHVVLWFAMMVIFGISMAHSVRFLRRRELISDHKAAGYASTGMLLGILGIITGAVWARHTWGAYWSFDVKQNMAAIALLIYAAYFILRSSLTDPDVSRRFSAVYNIFAFGMLIPLLYIIPRMTDSLHPGSGGNPAFGGEDLDNTMRMVFYPAIIGWILFGCWLANVTWRYLRLQEISTD